MRIIDRAVKILSAFIAISITLSGSPAYSFQLNQTDQEILNRIERSSLQYFIRFSDKNTGLTRDSSQPGSPASVAATGFALAALAIGQSRGWLDPQKSYDQIEKTLRFLLRQTAHKNGFFYHFVDARSGKRVWTSEASSIDTALLIAGALLAVQYFPGTKAERIAQRIYARVNWRWMMNGSDFICMGWKPEGGFLPYYWDSYNELMILEALAIGAPTYAVSEKAWVRWLRPVDEYNHRRMIHSSSGSLFTYQFAQAYIDFKKINDDGVDYFENSRQAALANRDYSLFFRDKFRSYSEHSWGLSASLGPGGYKAYGAKPGNGEHDGTIAPYAAVSSINFTPEESIGAILYFFNSLGKNLYGPFGFKDAFNLDKAWFANEYLGIDQGISVLMLENYLNQQAVWKKFMVLPAIQRWVEQCKLSKNEAL